jgi:VanZ family protein
VTPVLPRQLRRGILSGRQHALLAAGCVLFALYASLVPLDFRHLPLDEALARFRAICSQPVRIESKSDALANFLMGFPLGYLLTGALCVDRGRLWRLGAVAVPPLCVAVAAGLEFSQLYCPTRVSSLNDIVAQGTGAAAGVVLWLAAGQRVTDLARGAWERVDDGRRALRWLPAYLFLLVLVQTLPFDVTLSPAVLYHKFREGRVSLLPALGSRDPWEVAARQLWQVLYFLPLGVLAAHFPGTGWRRSSGWRRVLALGLVVVGGVEFLRLLVVSRSCTLSDVLLGAAAALTGWRATLWRRGRPSSALRPGLLAGWVCVAAFLNWLPFNFTTDTSVAWHRLQAIPLIPFVEYGRGDPINAFEDALHKALLYLILGVLLAPRGPLSRWRWVGLGVLLPAAVATFLEGGQLFLPTRSASLSDVLVDTTGAALGFVLARHFRVAGRPEAGSPGTPVAEWPVPATDGIRKTAAGA